MLFERGSRRDSLGDLLGGTAAAAQDLSAHGHLCGEHLGVVWALVGHLVRREVEVELRRQLLQLVLRVSEPALGCDACDQVFEEPDDEAGRSREPDGEVDDSDDRLEAVGEDRLLGAAARGLLSLAEQDRIAHTDLGGDRRQRLGAHDRGAKSGEVSFGQFGEGPVQVVSDDKAQDCVA